MELIIWIAFSYASYLLGKEKGYNPMFCGVMGFLFTIFALIVIALLPNKNQIK